MNQSWISSLARPEILRMKAYESARSLVAKNAGLVYLDANESPFEDSQGLNRYPEPQPRELMDRLSGIYGISREAFIVGRGSDEAIDLLVRAFCDAASAILICPPTYGMYGVAAAIQGVHVEQVPLIERKDTFVLDEAGIARALSGENLRVKLVFLCSPNNPTGTAFAPEALKRVCDFAAGRALVVIDEAYAEFSAEQSMLSSLSQIPNLIVLRTLSKAWALAGARCGIVAGGAEVMSVLNKIRAPYPVPTPVVRAVLDRTDASAEFLMRKRVDDLNAAKAALVKALAALPIVTKIFDSSANYLLIQFHDAHAVMKATRERGIIVRDRSSELPNCVRLNLGTIAENSALVRALQEVM